MLSVRIARSELAAPAGYCSLSIVLRESNRPVWVDSASERLSSPTSHELRRTTLEVRRSAASEGLVRSTKHRGAGLSTKYAVTRSRTQRMRTRRCAGLAQWWLSSNRSGVIAALDCYWSRQVLRTVEVGIPV